MSDRSLLFWFTLAPLVMAFNQMQCWRKATTELDVITSVEEEEASDLAMSRKLSVKPKRGFGF